MKELRLLIILCCLLFCGFANAQVTANAGNDTVVCADAPVILGGNPVVTGGTGPYTYVWSHGATTANPTVSPTSTTSYSLTVTDMMGEANVDVITVTVSTPILSPTINQVTCFGANDGSVCLNVVGGTVPFTYNWNSGITFTPCATNLAAGTYAVTVTDAAGCSVSATYSVIEPTAIQLSGTVTNATCFGSNDGSIDLTVTGGTPVYSYIWSTFITTEDASNLPAGTYVITVTDANACSVSSTHTVAQPTQIQLSIINNGDGVFPDTLNVSVSGGCSPYMYNWSNSVTTQSNQVTQNGTYSLTVTDCSGCNSTVSTSVSNLSAQITTGNSLCYNVSDGWLIVTASGGTTPYQYTVGNDFSYQTSDTFLNLMGGNYILKVKDATNQVFTVPFTIYEPTAILNTAVVTNETCTGLNNGAIDLSTTGGTAPYTFAWINGANAEDLAGLIGGDYIVTVTDANMCTESDTFTVVSMPSLWIDSVITINASCYGYADGNACIYTNNLYGNFTYVWNTNPVITTACGSNLAAGSYTVTITDVSNCTSTVVATITQFTAINLSFIAYDGYATDTINAAVSGGTGSYTFNWNTGSSQQWNTTSFCSPFTYIVTVTDANGCIQVDSVAMSGDNHCVWPGDADNNNIADNNDLLPIGLKYGTIGFARTAADINWEEHQADLWYDSLPNGTDSRYIDCDGNGTINADDTLAIVQNFGLTHSKNDEQKPWRASAPALLVDLIPDTTRAGDTMYANLYLGDASINATNVYGLAFTLNYDVNVIDTALTQMQFGNSWLGTATDKIHIAKDLKQGQIKCAVTRIDHTNRSGSGQIAQAKFVITTDNINGKDLAYYGMRVWVTDLVVIDNDGLELEVNEGQDSTEVEFEPLSVSNMPLADGSLKIQPNPANNMVQVNVTREVVGGSIKLMDMQGRSLFETPVTSTVLKLETTELANGIYLVQLSNGHGKLTKRLIVTH